MSHKLGGNYGFAEAGVEHDKYVRECVEQSDIRRLFDIDPDLTENAAECGLRAVMIMCGVLDGLKVKSEVLCYEAPYGVGYLTAKLTADGGRESLLPEIIADKQAKIRRIRGGEDDYVRLARESVEHFTQTGKKLNLPAELPLEMLENRAGVFVSIKKNGSLRGCIGTTEPTCASVAFEIVQNGISACSRDPRFEPVAPDELPELTYSVDVLFPPEPIADKSLLDVKKYGVIVSSGHKCGLLLPNLDGVDSIDEQLRIAMQKAGIKPSDKYALERFEVVRHT
jgi:AmmeMemoRadiSam system protein A